MRITNGTPAGTVSHNYDIITCMNIPWKLKIIFFFNIPKYHRSLFAQFRAGILTLNIETGRYRNVSLPDRFCTLCDDSEVEDEIHFLCVCKFYSEYRSDM